MLVVDVLVVVVVVVVLVTVVVVNVVVFVDEDVVVLVVVAVVVAVVAGHRMDNPWGPCKPVMTSSTRHKQTGVEKTSLMVLRVTVYRF